MSVYVQFFLYENDPKSKHQCKNELCDRLRELKNTGKVQLGNPKVVVVAYGSGRL